MMLSSISKSSLLKIINIKTFRLLACAASGILSSLPFFFDELFLLEWISLVPFFLLFLSQTDISKKQAFFYGFLTRFIQSVIVLSWFKELYSMSAVNVPSFIMIGVIFLGDVVLSALQSIPFGLCALFIRAVSKYGRFLLVNSVSVAAIYTFTEHFQTLAEEIDIPCLIGFPWVASCVTQHKFVCGIQSASIFGAMFITFLIILINILISYSVTSKRKDSLIALVLAATVFFSNTLYGVIAINTSHEKAENAPIKVAVYQDNNSSYNKWSSSSRDVCDQFISDIEGYFEQGNEADIILLSETVFTVNFDTERTYNSGSARYIAKKLTDFTQKHDCIIIFGGFSSDEDGEYNSLFMIENGEFNKTVYNKRTLVPFGEYLPFESVLKKILPMLENFNLSGSYLKPGNDSNVFESNPAHIGGIVCYDSIFSYNTRKTVSDGAQLIVLSTNDSWYNDSSAIYQHYAQSAFRAVETGRYLLRSASTGVSGIIDDHGRTIANSDIFEKTIVSGVVEKRSETTFFVKYGYSYLYILALLSVVYAAMSTIHSKRHRSGNPEKL